jgi:hypothetical protein
MTEDILFDNIYVGHSPEDAKAFAAETFDIKKPLESTAAKPPVEEEDEKPALKSDPIGFIREKILSFVALAQLDPVLAFKTQPEIAGTLVAAALTIVGMFGALFGMVGGQQKPITKVMTTLTYKLSWNLEYDSQQKRLKRLRRKRLMLHLLQLLVTRRRMRLPKSAQASN